MSKRHNRQRAEKLDLGSFLTDQDRGRNPPQVKQSQPTISPASPSPLTETLPPGLIEEQSPPNKPTQPISVIYPPPTLQMTYPESYEASVDALIKDPTFVATRENFERIESIRQRLETFVRDVIPYSTGVALFGSACSSVMAPNSDLDFAVLLNRHNIDPVIVLRNIKNKMKHGPFSQHLLVSGARVPVLKCSTILPIWTPEQTKSNDSTKRTQFDMIVENRLGMHNSEFIHTYCDCDERVRPFLLLVKKWAKAWEIGDASQQYLSSYGWNLMGLSFLQQCSPPIIPNLQSEAYMNASKPSLVVDEMFEQGHVHFSKDPEPWRSLAPGLLPNPSDPSQAANPRPFNDSSLASLFVGFIDFLAHHYVPANAFSLQHGAICKTDSIQHLIRPNKRKPSYVILDPFQRGRNVGDTVFRPEDIKASILETVEMIKKGSPFLELVTYPSA
ncbi:putative PAP/25A associated domain family [Blattamonas nauphoetae]|uniref:PAP/25A associated domain family n=1 Tax=Blattamonas nauphoetae TaxID=2049346 RepID=A0ABQ9YMJ0_9EUKA|nr:putative PAP/25A associated domain family [Blattamonas nauphoetae]